MDRIKHHLKQYREHIIREIEEECIDINKEKDISLKEAEYMHYLIATLKDIDKLMIYHAMNPPVSSQHTAEGGTDAQHRSGSGSGTSSMYHSGYSNNDDEIESWSAAYKNWTVDKVRDEINRMYQNGDKHTRDSIKKMLRDLRGEYVI